MEPEEKVIDETVAAYMAPVRSPAPIYTAAINYSFSLAQEGILLRPSSMGLKDRRRSKPTKVSYLNIHSEIPFAEV